MKTTKTETGFTRHHSESGFVHIILILVIVIVAIAGAYCFRVSKKNQNEVLGPIGKYIITTNTPTPNPMADWKTYSNSLYGIEFQYPRNWSLSGGGQNESINFGPALSGIKTYGVNLAMLDNPNSMLVEDYVSKLISDSNRGQIGGISFESKEVISISGKNGIILHKVFAFDQSEERIYLEMNNKIYRISYPIKEDNENLLNPITNYDTVQQILSTFKFLDNQTSDQILGWKFFLNDDFTFQYPGEWTITPDKRLILAETSGASIRIFDKNTPMYNECMKLDRTETYNDNIVKYYSYIYSGEACSNKGNLGNYEAWITKTGGDVYQPGIIYFYNTTAYPKSFDIFKLILNTFKFSL